MRADSRPPSTESDDGERLRPADRVVIVGHDTSSLVGMYYLG
jgi:hypothetical protein